jgi:hypothetical protein
MKVAHLENGKVWIQCPGCGIHHAATVDGTRGWTWNGHEESPSISPSILVTGEFGGDPLRCHSFVRDGQIQFLDDCSHGLKGTTVALPEWEGFNWFRPQAKGGA